MTNEQNKDLEQRIEKIFAYLKIAEKTQQLSEEELRTQDPSFWDDPKKAEAQMKVIRGLKYWVDGFKSLQSGYDDLQVLMEFEKEGGASADEVEEQYTQITKRVEELELKNMLSNEEDSLSAVIQITADNFDSSFLYRVSTENWKIDAIYKVGTVPKVVAVTPDNRYILVSHWCSYDLYVISTETQSVEKILKIGTYPRGITVSADSKYAFVSQMGGSTVHKINLDTWKREQLSVGVNPRAIVLSSDNSTLYATLNKSGQVVAYNLNEKKVIQKIKTGEAARSLDISSDGSSLYVVNFKSGTLSKIRVSDFQILQEIKVCKEPIGASFETQNQRVWVACYDGSIKVFDEV